MSWLHDIFHRVKKYSGSGQWRPQTCAHDLSKFIQTPACELYILSVYYMVLCTCMLHCSSLHLMYIVYSSTLLRAVWSYLPGR